MCVFACGQECELLMLPGTPVFASAPDCKMDKQLWDVNLLVDDEVQQPTDFKHRKWEFTVTTKVQTVDECLRLCVHACLQSPKLKC